MTRPMSEEREKAVRAAKRLVTQTVTDPLREYSPEDIMDLQADAVTVARALLSTSSSERGMREALEREIAAKTWNAAADFLDGKVEDMGDGWRVIGGARDTEKFMQRAWREASRIFRLRASDLAALTSKGEGE